MCSYTLKKWDDSILLIHITEPYYRIDQIYQTCRLILMIPIIFLALWKKNTIN